MVKVELKGIAKVTAKGRTYYYAWRGGPRLRGEPGIAGIHRHLQRGGREIAARPTQAASARLSRSTRRAATTRSSPTRPSAIGRVGSIALRIISAICASLNSTGPEKIRPVIRRWRNQWADKPRTADYGMQVLSRVLSYAVDPLGKIAGNPCEGIKQLYSGDRSEIIWTDADIAAAQDRRCSAGDRARGRPCRAHRLAARRPAPPVMVARRRGRDR